MIAILGPTASGKSAVAEELADRLDARIINADAFQVYGGFDIGTAKPDDRARYDLIDICDATDAYTAGRFVSEANALISDYERAGRHTLVCGGTGLYVRALFEGYREMGPVDPKARQALKEDLNNLGIEAVLEREQVSDDELSHDLRRNPQRLLRFLEKRRMPNEPRSEGTSWISERCKFAIDVPRDDLAGRIEARIRRMVKDGWVEEVRSLLDKGVPMEAPAFRALGYKHMAEAIAGSISLDEAVQKTIVATRQYAKRQFTWLRREPRLLWVDGSGGTMAVANFILNKIKGGK